MAPGPGAAAFELQGRLMTDEGGDVSLEGTLSGASGRSDFVFFPDDDGTYGLLLTPYDAAGTPRTDQAAVYAATRVSDEAPEIAETDTDAAGPSPGAPPGAAVPPATPAPSGVSRDGRLIGIWSTQTVMNSPAGSIATESRMQFRADGLMRDLGSRALGGIGDGSIDTGWEGGGEEADWRTDGDVLWVSYAGSQWVPFARFEVSGDRLLLIYLQDGSRQIWSRVPGS